MTTLSTTTSPNHRFHPAEYMHYGYLANGWNKPLRWAGVTAAIESVGIVGPSTNLNSWIPIMVLGSTGSGDMSAGIHYFRYRYKDSTTGYVSNPSEERTFAAGTISSGQYSVTFPIRDGGSSSINIIRSTDPKADRLVLEMTVAGGTEFFSAAEVDNSASSVVLTYGVTDAAIGVSFLPYPEFGHELPPITKYLVSHRRRIFAFGQVKHAIGTAVFTSTSVDITKGGTDPDWNDEVLGSATNKSVVKWYIRKDSDSVEAEIDYYDAGNNKIVLVSGYTGLSTSGAGESYAIYSKANTIWVSNPGYPEGFSTLQFLDSPQGEMSGRLTAGVGYGNSMVFFTENTMFKLAWDSGPLIDPFMVNLSTKSGAISQRTVVEA